MVGVEFDRGAYHKGLYHTTGVDLPLDIERSVLKRQAEFLAGRHVATTALQRYGTVERRVGRCGSGPPIWPSLTLGSISHSSALAFAGVSSVAKMDFLGLDVETLMVDGFELRSTFSTAAEWNVVSRSRVGPSLAATALFSAKESVFKALYPKVGDYFGFDAATLISWSRSNRRLVFQLNSERLVAVAGTTIVCSYRQVRSDAVLTVAARTTSGRPLDLV